jgi:hypothetical protein
LEAKKTDGKSAVVSNGAGHLRHITDEVVDSEELDIFPCDADDEFTSNDTNEDALIYFARISNHYLRLANASDLSVTTPRHTMKYPVIADSSANYHMFKEHEFFVDILPA